MKGCRVLVTGATGQVGSLVARRAAEAGYQVRAMIRSASKRNVLEGLGVELFEADLDQPKSLPPAVAGIDMVVHCAAHVGDWGPVDRYRLTNVFGLEDLVTAAVRGSRLKRWIQISSLGVYPARHHYGTDETVRTDPEGLDGYTRTKAEAEMVLRLHIEWRGFPAVILRPGFVYGPGDRHVVPQLVRRLQAGTLRMIGDGRKVLNNTYVGNLVDAILLAMDQDDAAVRGQTFNIRDQRLVTREEFIGALADYLGLPLPRRVPEWLAKLAVRPIEGLARVRRSAQAPLLTRARIKFMTLNLDFSIAKAQERLGYQPRVDFKDGMREALDWAAREGVIRRDCSDADH